jgi:hypothetical protein
VKFCQFLNESWTDVSSHFLTINEIPYIIQNEPQRAKNKVVKLKEARMYLTLKNKKKNI